MLAIFLKLEIGIKMSGNFYRIDYCGRSILVGKSRTDNKLIARNLFNRPGVIPNLTTKIMNSF